MLSAEGLGGDPPVASVGGDADQGDRAGDGDQQEHGAGDAAQLRGAALCAAAAGVAGDLIEPRIRELLQTNPTPPPTACAVDRVRRSPRSAAAMPSRWNRSTSVRTSPGPRNAWTERLERCNATDRLSAVT